MCSLRVHAYARTDRLTQTLALHTNTCSTHIIRQKRPIITQKRPIITQKRPTQTDLHKHSLSTQTLALLIYKAKETYYKAKETYTDRLTQTLALHTNTALLIQTPLLPLPPLPLSHTRGYQTLPSL